MTDLRQAAQQALEALEHHSAIKHPQQIHYRDTAIAALKAALEQQAEPTCPDCKAAVLYECVACSSNNYPPKQQAEPVTREGFEKWAKFAAPYMDISRFGAGYSDCNTDYAWAGWQAAQRQWVGLTDEDYKGISSGDQVVAMWADRTLKERNGY